MYEKLIVAYTAYIKKHYFIKIRSSIINLWNYTFPINLIFMKHLFVGHIIYYNNRYIKNANIKINIIFQWILKNSLLNSLQLY